MSGTEAQLAAEVADLQLQVARLQNERSAMARDYEALAYAVSHDLRAPLRSLSGFSQALLDLPGNALDPKAAHYLQRIQQAGHKLSASIEALLTLSRVAQTELRPQQVDLSQLCSEAGTAVRARFATRAIDVRIDNGMLVTGDPTLLRIAIDALLENACKFNRAATILITIRREPAEPGMMLLAISDNGVGFDMAYADKLFEPFRRMHAEAEYPGLGMGLATVRRIAARHGGCATVRAQPLSGTTVLLMLPEA
jgi:signal transduction histidine kinase